MTDRDDALWTELGWTGPEETEYEPPTPEPTQPPSPPKPAGRSRPPVDGAPRREIVARAGPRRKTTSARHRRPVDVRRRPRGSEVGPMVINPMRLRRRSSSRNDPVAVSVSRRLDTDRATGIAPQHRAVAHRQPLRGRSVESQSHLAGSRRGPRVRRQDPAPRRSHQRTRGRGVNHGRPKGMAKRRPRRRPRRPRHTPTGSGPTNPAPARQQTNGRAAAGV